MSMKVMKKAAAIKTGMMALFGGAMAFCAYSDSVAIDTNTWQVTSGKWSEGANWSLGHAPKSWEYAFIPDNGDISIELDTDDCTCGCFYADYRNSGGKSTLTLYGEGKLTAIGYVGTEDNPTAKKDVHYTRNNRKLVFDGTKADFQGSSILIYSDLYFVNGAEVKFTTLSLWQNGSNANVEDSTITVTGSILYNYGTRTLKILNGGTMTAANLGKATDTSNKIDVEINDGGTLTLTGGKLQLKNASTFTLNEGGTFSCTSIDVDDTATMNLLGGLFKFGGSFTAEYNQLVANSKGTKFEFTNTGNKAFMPFTEDNPVYTWKGDLTISGGMCLTNASTLRMDDDAVLNMAMVDMAISGTSTDDADLPKIDCRKIVFHGGGYPFYVDGDQRRILLLGPVTIATTADISNKNYKVHYTLVKGDCTIDTADSNDSTVKRNIYLKTFGARDYANLTIRGGGKVTMSVAAFNNRFQRVIVDKDTELEIMAPEGGTDWGHLACESFTLGENATLRLQCQTASSVWTTGRGARVDAQKWSIDPTAKIIATGIDENLANGVRPLLCGDSTDSLPANCTSQVTIDGNPEGWAVEQRNGAVYVWKKVADPDGSFTYEWTGMGSDNNFKTVANWQSGTIPPESELLVFGGANTRLNPYFDYVYNYKDNKNGTTIGGFFFTNTAVNAFTITGKNQATMVAPNPSGEASGWSVSSQSAVPQDVHLTLRTVANKFAFGAFAGPILVGNGAKLTRKFATADTGWLKIFGDVRMYTTSTSSDLTSQFQEIQFYYDSTLHYKYIGTSSGYRYTATGNGTEQRFYGQTTYLNAISGWASIAVDDGVSLIFNNEMTSGTRCFCWNGKPSVSRIDGTLELNLPFKAKNDQYYAGSGTIRFNNTATLTEDGKIATIGITDKLNVELPSGDWKTATASAPAGALSISVLGEPTLFTGGDWKYGVEDGVTATSSATDRALKLEAGGKLTIDAGKGTATIAENVTGRGTLAITNGTMEITGTTENRVGLEIAKDAEFRLGNSNTFKSLKANAGSTLTMVEGAELTVVGDADVTGATVDLSALTPGRWARVLTIGGELSGMELPANYATRVTTLADGSKSVEVKRTLGTRVIIR